MKYAAVIVESREHPELVDVIANHLSFLPEGWDFIMYGSAQNRDIVLKNFPQCQFHEIDFFQFLKQWGPLPHINAEQYNRLMTHKDFWLRFREYEKVLIFQTDSMLLRPGIEAFLKWDYVGAPWGHFSSPGGNGGLSIRNPRSMYGVCDLCIWGPEKGNEDVFFGRNLHIVGGTVAPTHEAMKFSVETIFYPTPIGCHAPEKYLKPHQLKQLYA